MNSQLTVVLSLSICLCFAFPAVAGDNYWSTTGLYDAQDLDVCGTTLYLATLSGLYRSQGDPESWELVWPNQVSRVACDGDTVLFVVGAPYDGPVMVSHDAMQTTTVVSGLDSYISEGVEDLHISGSTALAGFGHGVLRSSNSGSSFNVNAVLWNSSGDWEIKSVWTNGTECVAAGSAPAQDPGGGGYLYGPWYSATCEPGSFNVIDVAGQPDRVIGSGDILVAGDYYNDEYSGTAGYLSDDAGASWTNLPISWSGANGDYNRPFISDPVIMSATTYKVFDNDLNDFVGHLDGLYLYKRSTGEAANLVSGFPQSDELWLKAIVETSDPFLIVTEQIDVWAPISPAEVWWYRIPGGWPGNFDFTPPSPGALSASPMLAVASASSNASLGMSATGASTMKLGGTYLRMSAWWDAWVLYSSAQSTSFDISEGWEPYTTSRTVSLPMGAGLYIVDAWYGDARGNTSDPSVWDAVTIVPSSLVLGEYGVWATYVYAQAGESFSIGATGSGGDIDVYHWAPGSGPNWTSYSILAGIHDTLNVTAAVTGFHEVYLFNYPGLGSFNGSITVSGSHLAGSALAGPERANTPAGCSTEHHEQSQTALEDWLVQVPLFADGFESGTTSEWSPAGH